MAWEMVKLGSVCELKYGKNLPKPSRMPGDVNVYGSNGIVDTHSQHLIHAPALVIGRKGSIGKIHYQKQGRLWPIDTTYYVDETLVDASLDWLYYIFSSLDLSQMNKAAAIPGLNRNDVYEVEIPLPPLPEQQRIATLLEKVDHLRQLRQQALRRLDDLVQATFLEMFGDPVTNPKGWEKTSLSEGLSFLTSGSRGWAQYYSNKGAKFIRIQNVKNGVLNFDDVQYVNAPDSQEAKRTKVQKNDLLISITADLGRTAVVDKETAIKGAHINQHLALLRLKEGWHSRFISSLLETSLGKTEFEKLNQSAVKAGLNFDAIRSVSVILPPYSLQKTFETVFDEITAQKHNHQTALAQLDTLFNALMQQAFTGQLQWNSDTVAQAQEQLRLPLPL